MKQLLKEQVENYYHDGYHVVKHIWTKIPDERYENGFPQEEIYCVSDESDNCNMLSLFEEQVDKTGDYIMETCQSKCLTHDHYKFDITLHKI